MVMSEMFVLVGCVMYGEICVIRVKYERESIIMSAQGAGFGREWMWFRRRSMLTCRRISAN